MATPDLRLSTGPAPTPVLVPRRVPIEDDYGVYVYDTRRENLWFLGQTGSFAKSPIAAKFLLQGDGIAVVDLDLNTAVRLVEGRAGNAVWSDDGSRIEFRTFDLQGNTTGTFSIRSDGSDLQARPAVSGLGRSRKQPNGNLTAFVEANRLHLDNGTNQRIIWEGQNVDIHTFNSWSPDGRWLAFYDAPNQYIYDSILDEVRFVLARCCGALDWSADGTRVLLHRSLGPRSPVEVYVFSPSTEAAPTDSIASGWPADLSEDGKSLAYVTDGCYGDPWDLFVVSTEGLQRKHIASFPDARVVTTVKLSPDSRSIALGVFFKRQPGVAVWAVFIVDVSTGQSRAVAWPAENSAALLGSSGVRWSADGRFLMFHTSGGYGVCDG